MRVIHEILVKYFKYCVTQKIFKVMGVKESEWFYGKEIITILVQHTDICSHK